MIVLLAWVAAVVVAVALLAVLGLELLGHLRRLRAALAQARDLVPLAQQLAARLGPAPAGAAPDGPAEVTPEPGRHRAEP